jgi:transposase-like protein
MVDGLLTTRGIIVSRETVRRWAPKFGQDGPVLDILVRSRRKR